MWPFDRFPYTDFHRLNADWIVEKVKEAAASVAESLGLVRQSAADAAAAAAAAEQAVDGSVRYDRAQELTQAQQLQAQHNMNVVDASVSARIELSVSDLRASAVLVDQPQAFTPAQQAQARENIGAASEQELIEDITGLEDLLDLVSGVANKCVRYDGAQGLTEAQQAQARANIGAASSTDLNDVEDAVSGAVRYDQAQTLTGTERNQARGNIGALAQTDPNIIHSVELVDDTVAGGEGDELIVTLTSVTDQSKVLLAGQQSDTVIVSGVASPVNLTDASNKSYVDGRITANAPLLVQFTGSDDAGNAACNLSYSEIRNALYNNRAVHMVCLFGGVVYDLLPYRITTAPQSVGGSRFQGFFDSAGAADSYLTIDCNISSSNQVSVRIVDNM